MLAILAAISLPPCPRRPNCVSTQATDAEHAIAPIRYNGTAAEAMQRLVAILRNIPRTTITSVDAETVRAKFRTRVFRFVDDAVFVLDDDTKTIHFRAAARLGRRGFGVSRARMESVRAAFEKTQAP